MRLQHHLQIQPTIFRVNQTKEEKKHKLMVHLLQVYYRRERGLQDTQAENDEEVQVLTFTGNRSEGRLPGLQPYSLYSLFIRVLNSRGEGPPSPSKAFETPEGGMLTIMI